MHLKKSFFVSSLLLFYKYFFMDLISINNIGRVCHGSYHWRCVKPETISHYRENEKYVCDKCNDAPMSNSSNRLTNGGNKMKTNDPIDIEYQDFSNVPSTSNSTETNVVNTIRYFEGKQQQSQPQRTTKLSELDSYLPLQTNGIEYHHHDSKTD
jgi:hypothetical protein